ncbi:hypothetical protein Zmor_001483 [Zophobas morio]|uniref:Uncharacterized protein n=1 Tax=Zophobas morio TaxID=2755281 RepID=A0AA38J224_9CUCU|nr:hypothetical protein Zmor_001483 [Zophobas morio]
MSDSEDDVPSEIENVAKETISNLLASKSKELYEMAYKRYEDWCRLKNVKITSEKAILAYFSEKAKSQKASTVISTTE